MFFNFFQPFYQKIIAAALNALVMCLAAKRFYLFLQLNSYYPKRGYFKIIKTRYFLYCILTAILPLCFAWQPFVCLICYCGFGIAFLIFSFTCRSRVLLKYTKRIIRLHITTFLLLFIFGIYFDIVFTPLVLIAIVLTAFFINMPLENIINNYYIKKAKAKLQNMPNLFKIAIVGSWGKTSVKQILEHILSNKYSVLATPGSYNTPLGISSVINNTLKPDTQVFIAEMGAKRIGDIKYLTKLLDPDIAIITGVGNQHLETFGSIENIIKAKYEICQNLKSNAVCVFNIDNDVSAGYAKQTTLKSITVSIKTSAGIYAEVEKTSEAGTYFLINFADQNKKARTRLLGEHNVLNIMLAVAAAMQIGMDKEEIISRIATIPQIKHRLELISGANGTIIIDDSYNANSEGVEHALKVLKDLNCKNKIVVTPGIVELGKMQYDCNFTYAKQLASVCDYVIIVGNENKKALTDGLAHMQFDMHKLFLTVSLSEASNILKDILHSNDAVLFANDLPDNFV